ncbi:MAG: MBL fold metallo-hydrolase [Treponema sp.]|jgi:glyoxylase-like metal-dependent hydrolase (beta-lactamase superfamily II)|nr:MBL fold metallo-hydrolase [Treponema sp.]
MTEHVIVGKLEVNCWIIPLDKNPIDKNQLSPCILIDPGADAANIISRLETLRLYPQTILLTHGHFDHTGAVAELMDFFREQMPELAAPVLAIHKDDAVFVNPETQHMLFDTLSTPQRRFAQIIWAAMPLPTRLLKDGDEIGPFKVIHTPGHSLGSVCFFDQVKNQLFSGDTLFAGGIGRSDGPGGSTEAIGKSLKKLLLMDKNIEVFPGHGPTTTIENEFWMKDN